MIKCRNRIKSKVKKEFRNNKKKNVFLNFLIINYKREQNFASKTFFFIIILNLQIFNAGNAVSTITLTIEGTGDQYVINSNFQPLPSEIDVNQF